MAGLYRALRLNRSGSARFNRQERGWITYDWANSAYSTIVTAAIFPIYFASAAGQAGASGDIWWGYGTSAATLIMAVMAPLLGAIGDFKGMKKKLFSGFLLGGLVFTLAMALTDRWQLMLVGYVLSYIGWMGANLFYDSFLTDVTRPSRMDKVSAWGFAMGYIGGSTIPFLMSIALIMFGPAIGIDNAAAVKIACVLCVLWWAVFSLPLLRDVHQTHYLETPPTSFVRQTFRNLLGTAREILADRALLIFMLAYFFYIDGVNTVIHMATVYGSAIGLDTTGMILALLVTQLVAVPFSILFSRLAGRFGSIRMISAAIIIYFFICLVGFYMGYSMEQAQAILQNGQSDQLPAGLTPAAAYDRSLSRATALFWAMAVLVGTCQGGIQALSRSFFGKLIPPKRSNEYFGFFDIFGKFAAVVGPVLYALTASLTGRSSLGILSLLLLFAIGLILILIGRRPLQEAEARAEAGQDREEQHQE